MAIAFVLYAGMIPVVPLIGYNIFKSREERGKQKAVYGTVYRAIAAQRFLHIRLPPAITGNYYKNRKKAFRFFYFAAIVMTIGNTAYNKRL